MKLKLYLENLLMLIMGFLQLYLDPLREVPMPEAVNIADKLADATDCSMKERSNPIILLSNFFIMFMLIF